MKTHKKGFVVPLLLVLIAALLIGGGVYAYIQKNQSNQSAVTSIVQTSDSQTADLNNYSQYGITLKYPQNWVTLGDGNPLTATIHFIEFSNQKRTRGVDSIPNNYVGFELTYFQDGYLLPQAGSTKEYLSDSTDLTYFIRIMYGLLPPGYFNNAKKETMQIGGIQAVRYLWGTGQTTPWVVKVGGSVYDFQYRHGRDVKEQDAADVLNQILTTVHFVQ